MVRRATGWVSVALACGCIVGCAKTDTDGIPREQLSAKVAEIFCESIGGCCKSSGFSFDSASCRSKIASEYALVLSDTTSSNVIYNEQAAGECLASVRGTLVCGKSGQNGSDGVCGTVFQGKLKAGQVCTSEQECEHPAGGFAFCDAPTIAGDPKVCVTQGGGAHGAAGQPCGGSCSGDICVFGVSPAGDAAAPSVVCYKSDGLVCGTTGVCERLSARGESCADTSGCQQGSYCDPASSVCAAPLPAGAKCGSDDDCASGSCDENAQQCATSGVTAEKCAMPTLL